jgi:hypothetical protein
MTGPCSSGCPPEPEVPRLARACWWLYSIVTWPLYVRQLKQMGFRRTGWMTWDSGPDA